MENGELEYTGSQYLGFLRPFLEMGEEMKMEGEKREIYAL